jgi:hypothetical protein
MGPSLQPPEDDRLSYMLTRPEGLRISAIFYKVKICAYVYQNFTRQSISKYPSRSPKKRLAKPMDLHAASKLTRVRKSN